jgi:hypothetical protein
MTTLTIKRSTFVTNWTIKPSKGYAGLTGTQTNQRLELVDAAGRVLSETCTGIDDAGKVVVAKVGWVVTRKANGAIVETGWTVNEKNLARKWFATFIKSGEFELRTAKIDK